MYILFVCPSKSIEYIALFLFFFFAKKIYEMHLIMHTIDELRYLKDFALSGRVFGRAYVGHTFFF